MMCETINQYGDKLVENKGYGSDIASQRFDDLDNSCIQKALEFASKGSINLIDFGSGRCSFINKVNECITGKYPDSTANLIAVDFIDFNADANESVNFICSGMIEYLKSCDKNSIDIIYSQRTIHYLTYQDAFIFLKMANDCLRLGGYIFISASGLKSELSKSYLHKDRPIKNRFSLLSDEMMEKHGIRKPVCLYKPIEIESLIKDTGFNIVSIKSSNFGNIKCIGIKNGRFHSNRIGQY